MAVRGYVIAVLLALILALAGTADAQFTQEFNDTVNAIRDTINSLKLQVSTLKDRLENTTEAISNKISANVQAVEDRVQTQFDVFIDDAKGMATAFLIATVCSLVGVIIGGIFIDLAAWYCRRKCLRRFVSVGNTKKTDAAVAPATAAPPTDNVKSSLLRRAVRTVGGAQ